MTLSPDGQWMWDGNQWIPAPPTQSPPTGSIWASGPGVSPYYSNPSMGATTYYQQRPASMNVGYLQQPAILSPMRTVSNNGMKWEMPLWDQITGFRGRINRQRYIFLSIATTAVMFVIGIVIGFSFYYVSEETFAFILAVLMAPQLYIQASLMIQRLQDTGRGDDLWYILVLLYCIFSMISVLSPIGSESESVFGGFALLAVIVPSIICLFVPGEPGPNKWGSNPLGSRY